uniref:Uncharacterized protein n=1 Tax=Rhizophora mucronata TaxID=61149 RepID=A0A2P2Q2Q9_RHIMU
MHKTKTMLSGPIARKGKPL